MKGREKRMNNEGKKENKDERKGKRSEKRREKEKKDEGKGNITDEKHQQYMKNDERQREKR